MTKGVLALLAVATISSCSLTPNLLGGREKCWAQSDSRAATLMEGRLDLVDGSDRGTLSTSDGTDFDVQFPFMTVRWNGETVPGLELVDDGRTVAFSGETVTVFGGYGSDGVLVVCAIEERGG